MDELNPGDPNYPALLGAIPSPPTLYVRGAVTVDDALALAIVGARDATPYGVEVAERLAGELGARGVTIVSGLARGIDAAAHRGALDAGGRTLAVLGCGIDVVYPPENRALARAIEAQGALVSQFAHGAPALAGHFPARNRTLAGLSLGVVVVEAAERSGALITAGSSPRASRRRSSRSSWAGGPGSLRDSDGSRSAPAQGERSGEAIAGRSGIAHEGEDDPEVSGLELHRQSVDGPCARSAEVPARRRSQEGVQAEVRRLAREEEGPRRAEEGGRERRHPLRRHGSRPRRRGDRLAPGPGARRRQEQRLSRLVQRDHRARGAERVRQARAHRPQEGRRAAGAPRARPSRRLQALPAPLGQGPARALGRTGAVGGRPVDRGSRARDPGVRPSRILVAPRAARRQAPARVRRDAEGGRRREGVVGGRGRDARAHGVAPGRPVPRQVGHARRAPPEPGAAIHHLDPATGGGPEARLHREEDDGGRPAALRGYRPRSRGREGPHHLYAHRLGPRGARSAGGGAGVDHGSARTRVRARGAARLPLARERPGGARGDPTLRGPPGAEERGAVPHEGPARPLSARLGARPRPAH